MSPIVTVFGAGIAGLSAAHELIERGFSVQVVEPRHSPDEEFSVEVGGMAANQFGRVKENPILLHGGEPADKNELEIFRRRIELVLRQRTSRMSKVQPRYPVPWRIQFVRNERLAIDRLDARKLIEMIDLYGLDEWGASNGMKLVAAWEIIKDAYHAYNEDALPRGPMSGWQRRHKLPRAWRCRERLLVEIRAHTDGDFDEASNRARAEVWGNAVLAYLQQLNDKEKDQKKQINQRDFLEHFRVVPVGSAEPLGDQREERWRIRSNRVEFRIVEQLIPGEHGYRFFPAFYRHLFDTMRRTPILDEHDRESGQTAFDRLVATRDFGLALKDGLAPASVETRRIRSLEELRRHSELFLRRLGATHRDIARFQIRLLKFLTSSSERRTREYEHQSWWTFLGGDDDRGYSDKMRQYLREAPQALVAMNAEETDARSQGNIVAQLQLHYLEDQFDLTLNGPTTSVWLREWKRYLKRQGVRFFTGELGKLEWRANKDTGEYELVPLTTHRSGWLEAKRDRPVVALSTNEDEEVEEDDDRDERPDNHQDYGTPKPTALLAEGEKPLAAPVVRPARTKVKVEVLGHDDGDYIIEVAGRRYCEPWRSPEVPGSTAVEHCQWIAEALAKRVNRDPVVSAKAPGGARIEIEERREVRLEIPGDAESLEFDDSEVAGKWKDVRAIDVKQATAAVSAAVEGRLAKKLRKAVLQCEAVEGVKAPIWQTIKEAASRLPDAAATAELEGIVDKTDLSPEQQKVLLEQLKRIAEEVTGALRPARIEERLDRSSGWPPVLQLADDEWLRAGLLRQVKKPIGDDLYELEKRRRPRRELVPVIRVEPGEGEAPAALKLLPPPWLKDVPDKEGPKPLNFEPASPYYFRTRSATAHIPYIWVSVDNPHHNLRVLDEPIPEEPTQDYLSHDEENPTFRPDFYVLALPLDAVSALVWRAEQERPDGLDGCLAEVMRFDLCTGRRSRDGELLPVARDEFGRPPRRYPLRDFSGIQYYFHNHVRIGRGHIYFPEAEWGLSSISQLAYWRERMSPRGAFMGQLSVDIGNLYAPAPPRRGGREQHSGWMSTSDEIASEVWQQVRQGLESQHAGVLAEPDYYHIDDGLIFTDALGSAFRNNARIRVAHKEGCYTVWVSGHAYSTKSLDSAAEIANRLKELINRSPCGTLSASVQTEPKPTAIQPDIFDLTEKRAFRRVDNSSRDELDAFEAQERQNRIFPGGRKSVLDRIKARRKKPFQPPTPPADRILCIRSNVPAGAAFVHVTGSDPGAYEVIVAGKHYRTQATTPWGTLETRTGIRNRLFTQIVQDPSYGVTAKPSGDTGLLLVADVGQRLPAIEVRNDHDNLSLSFGPILRVRLEQCGGALKFQDPDSATIGYNATPFLINVPDQWQHRPGVQPPRFDSSDAHGQEHSVSYAVSNRRWVAAGTFMATTTRLTTMEAANESARHAVNAILHQLVTQQGSQYNAQGRMFADWAEIWDPERNELDDLEPLRRLDRKLAEEGLPHVLDILKVIESVDSLPMHGRPSHDPTANALHLLQHAGEGLDEDWGFIKETLYGLVAQVAERAHDNLDPLGLFREGIRGRPGNIIERLRRAVRSFTEDPAGSAQGGGNPSGT